MMKKREEFSEQDDIADEEARGVDDVGEGGIADICCRVMQLI